MPRVDLTLSIDIKNTPKVKQLEGLFDVPTAKRRTVDFHFDVPFEEQDWRIGLIVGPSGAGKSTVAKHLFGDAVIEGYEWSNDKGIVDAFGNLPIRDITTALNSVGFSVPPSWTKPFRVLSTGEKFRATIARALLDKRELIIIDEFTSVIDRQIAKIGSFAVSKAVRRHPRKRFVAVTCHDDIVEWLQPDWVLEPHVGRFRWRSVQRRPDIQVEVVRCDYSSWKWFSSFHYLTTNLHKGARCFVGLIDEKPAAFAGIIHFPHSKRTNIKSLSRLVVLPDYQGIGLGSGSFIEEIAMIAKANDACLSIGSSHPVIIRSLAKSLLWKMKASPSFCNPSAISRTSKIKNINPQHSWHRRVAHFHYVGPGFETREKIDAAKRLWALK